MPRRPVLTIAHVIMVIGLLAIFTVLPTTAQDNQTTHVVQRGENLYRIGGHPTWIQPAEYPTCPNCCRLMPIFLQLDSHFPTEGFAEFLWGSGGICYVCLCGECGVSASFWQCT